MNHTSFGIQTEPFGPAQPVCSPYYTSWLDTHQVTARRMQLTAEALQGVLDRAYDLHSNRDALHATCDTLSGSRVDVRTA